MLVAPEMLSSQNHSKSGTEKDKRRLSPSTKEVTHGSHSSCLSAVLTTMRMCLFKINDWQVAFTNLNCFLVGSSSVSRNSATASEHLFNRNAARVDWRIDNPISDILIDSFGRTVNAVTSGVSIVGRLKAWSLLQSFSFCLSQILLGWLLTRNKPINVRFIALIHFMMEMFGM
ncbi:hypothetical protein HID58_059410 [Brassica napus]|uniref:Uncharacterized protein n=1 Tax=Brassica napus TaxID=3708 RepID=A0ABQ7ZSU8_BRANA|nr:hypothetical protein HID58_059410 [Brassica napus]